MSEAEVRLNVHMSKCHIVGNHMSRLIYHTGPYKPKIHAKL